MSLATVGKGKTGPGPGGEVADYVLNRLKEWGIERIFGYPGDGINGFLGAFHRAEGKPEFIQVRHEEMAAFMATAHAKFTGDVGVCIATSGPGAIHLLNGLYDAKMDHQPVVAIIGQQKQLSIGADYQQEVDLNVLFKDVSAYVTTVTHPASARHAIDRAIRIAMTTRSVSTVIFPEDIQESKAMEAPPRMHGSVYSSIGWIQPEIMPPKAQLERAAELLNSAKKVAMLVGQGAAKAENEVIEAAEVLGCGIAKALLGRAHPPDDLPFVTGPIGLLGTKPSNDMVMGCDLLFMVGTSFPYAEWLPKEGSCKCVQIDIDGRYIANRFPVDVPLVGDAKCTLRELMPLLKYKEDRSWREKIEKEVRQWHAVLEDRALQKGEPMNPQRVIHELSPRLPDGCILTADSGSATNWWARHLKMRKGMEASLSGTLATMGAGTPYAIGARFAFPDRPVIAVVGDGAFQMNGMNEMITVKRYLPRLMKSGAPFIFCIFNNQDLNQVTWEQRVLAGDPKFMGTQFIPDFPYAKYAMLLGFKGIYCDRAEKMGEAWDEALNTTDLPVVLEVKTDQETPPLPPHIKFEMARKMASALISDEPERWGIMKKSAKGKAVEFKETLVTH
ncbi:MAG TPA: thiamine pyrophosphate-requiring protein [Verrucomicrobiae bacterium]|nr:thiamine pyrophosphate-requiring protein [Verrucomicrobiae bacterium]